VRVGRRTRWIVAGGLGVLLLAAGGLLLALWASTPARSILAVEARELPEAWLTPGEPALMAPTSGGAAGAEEASPQEVSGGVAPRDVRQRGSLVFIGNGRRFGEETYELVVGEEGASLTSSGAFEVRILLATFRATFSQSLTEDAALRPTSYALHLDAPFGFGREIRTEISADGAVSTPGKEGSNLVVDPDRASMMGTFSTYTLLPFAFKAREESGVASFDVLAFTGRSEPEHGRSGSPGGGLTSVSVERLGNGSIRADGREIQVERYRVRSALGDSVLLARQDEFLGFLAGEGNETLFVYRSDYFPRGFDLLP